MMYIYNSEAKSTLLLYQSCDELKELFLALNEPRDVADLLEVSYGRLKYHISKLSEDRRYRNFTIPKKSGQSRTISAPRTPLKILQRKLSQVLYSVYEPKATVHGFVPARSILTNAEQHVHKRFILNIDLKDFFHSIHFGRVRGMFMKPPYNLSIEVSTTLAKICCHLGRLPQGAPTSPVVSNMICVRMDSELRKLAKEYKCTYTRYADDITFSTTSLNFPSELAHLASGAEISKVVLGERLNLIIQSNGFEVNDNKIRLQHKSNHQEVTGLTVNKFPNVKRSFIREISSMLYAWDKFGLESAERKYHAKYAQDIDKSGHKPPPFKEIPSFKEVLRGKINFLGMVRGKDNGTYYTYSEWFYALSKRESVER